MLRELGVAAGQAGAEREQADAVLAGGQHAGGRGRGGDGDREARVGVGREVEAGFAQLEPVGLHRDRLVAGEQAGDGVERLVHHRPLLLGLDAHHVGVGDQRAGAAAEHRAAARHVVELHEALRHQEGVVVGQAGDAGAEHDVPGALGGGGDEDLGRGDQLPAGRVVLADPGLVVAELVEPGDELEVAREGQGRVVAHAVEGREEDAEAQAAMGHGAVRLSRVRG